MGLDGVEEVDLLGEMPWAQNTNEERLPDVLIEDMLAAEIEAEMLEVIVVLYAGDDQARQTSSV